MARKKRGYYRFLALFLSITLLLSILPLSTIALAEKPGDIERQTEVISVDSGALDKRDNENPASEKIENEIENPEDHISEPEDEELKEEEGDEEGSREEDNEEEEPTEEQEETLPEDQLDENPLHAQNMDQRAFLEDKVRASSQELIDYYIKHPPRFPYISENNQTTSSTNYWIFSALWASGFTDLKNRFRWIEGESPFEPYSYWTVGKKEDTVTNVGAKEDAGAIIGAILLGKDPRKFGNETYRRDIVQDLVNKQKDNGSFSDQWGEPWVMIALDLVDADYDRDRHIKHLLSLQGGRSFGGADVTGWALIALAPYRDDPQIEEAIQKAVGWVHDRFQRDGEVPGQDAMGGPNSNSTAAIIHGLAAVREDLLGEKWTVELGNLGKVNIVERFIDRYQMEDGRFKWKETAEGDWGKASEQALLALLEVLHEQSTFQRLKKHRKDVLDQTTRVSARVEGRTETLVSQRDFIVQSIAEKATVLDALKQIVDQEGIKLEITGTGEHPVIERIGKDQSGDPDDLGEWRVLVNGKKLAGGINGYTLVPDDQLLFYYGNEKDLYVGQNGSDSVEQLTLLPEISLLTKRAIEGKPIELQVSATYNKYKDQSIVSNHKESIAGAKVVFNGKDYKTDHEGVVRIPGEAAQVGSYELSVTKDIDGSYPRLLRSSQKISIEADDPDGPGNPGQPPNPPSVRGSVSIAIHGPVGKGYLLAPTKLSLENGDTAYSVLERAMPGQVSSIGSGSSLYVRSIGGLGEFDHGPDSGWMYAVNGSFPNYSAGSYTLSDGDHVDWRYTTDLGKDIGGYIPDVEKGSGGAGSSPKPEEVRDALSRLSFGANNQKPVHEISKTVIVQNLDRRMSQQDAEALQRRLQNHQFAVSGSVSPTVDGTINDSEREVTLFVPKGAITKTTAFKIEKLKEHTFKEAISGVYEFSPIGATFNEPVQISIRTPLLVQDLEQLALVWWNEKTKQWIPVPAIVDAETGYVTGIVDHFTKFAVIDKAKLGIKVQGKHISALENALKWIQQKEEWSEWDIIGLAQAGEKVPVQYLAGLKEWLIAEQGEFRKVTDYERIVLALTALGEDPYTFAGFNLIEKIYNNERMTLQGINGPIFALIALDSKDYKIPGDAKWSRETLIQYIVENQNKDGGFSLSSTQSKSDVDITAMVLQGLTNYKQRPDVKKVIDQAVDWLSSQQNKDGGYSNTFGEVNSESVAQVIIALSGLGIDPDKDEKFIKPNGSLLTNLLTYVTKDGGFAHVQGQKSNDMATEQAVLALVAYHRFQTKQPALYDMNNSQKQVGLPYTDVGEISSWALEAVQQAWEANIMRGVSTTNPRFEPKRAMTRAEFATLLVQLMDEQGMGEASAFKDVSKNDWFYDSVSIAIAKGWMKGRSERFFNPRGEITREEVAVIIGRILAVNEGVSEAAKVELLDYHKISPWAQALVSQIYQQQIMLGDGHHFNPQEKVTREMAAVLMMRLYENR